MGVKKRKALFLQFGKNVSPHIRLYFYAKNVAPVIYKPNANPAYAIYSKKKGYHAKEKPHGALRDEGI